MKTISVLVNAATVISLLSVLICGLWIRNNGNAVDASSIQFHVNLGVATVVIAIIAVAMNWWGVGRVA